MALVRRAVIDVGTNSVKLLVADVDGRAISPVFEESEQTRLGKGFYENNVLRSDLIQSTASAVAEYAAIARLKEAQSIRVIATSAARDALNQRELLDTVEKACGLPVEVISGQQEAEWAYQGVRSDTKLSGRRLLIMDVGGGSTEFILGETDQPEFSQSFPLGAVRMLERLKPSDPPNSVELVYCRQMLKEFVAEKIAPQLGSVLSQRRNDTLLIGTGGSASILARMELILDKYSRPRIDGARIPFTAVQSWMNKLWAMTLMERRNVVGLPKKRADVILTGLAIYEAVMEQFSFNTLQTSTRGLRFAAVMQAHEQVPS